MGKSTLKKQVMLHHNPLHNMPDEVLQRTHFFSGKLNFNQLNLVLSGKAEHSDFINVEETEKEFQDMMLKKKNTEDELESLLKNTAPCPFCAGTEVRFNYSEERGHGDCGFSNLRVSCVKCNCSKGNVSNYGSPTIQDKIKVLKEWNQRNLKPLKMETPKYYTPQIEEFHVGFEYEELQENGEWIKDGIHYAPQVVTLPYQHLENIRVKRLDREDIKTLEWKHIKTHAGTEMSDFELGSYGMSIDFDFKGKTHVRIYDIDEEYDNELTFFSGFLNNKSELKRIMRQLNIS